MFTKAIEWDEAEANPCRGLKMLREPSHRIRFLACEELEAVKAKADTETRQLITVATETGLPWPDVDMADGLIHVLNTKGGKPREVPMTPGVRAVLEERRREN